MEIKWENILNIIIIVIVILIIVLIALRTLVIPEQTNNPLTVFMRTGNYLLNMKL